MPSRNPRSVKDFISRGRGHLLLDQGFRSGPYPIVERRQYQHLGPLLGEGGMAQLLKYMYDMYANVLDS
jgi:hypothetical protein